MQLKFSDILSHKNTITENRKKEDSYADIFVLIKIKLSFFQKQLWKQLNQVQNQSKIMVMITKEEELHIKQNLNILI